MEKETTVYKNIFWIPQYNPYNDIKRIIIENLNDVKLKAAEIRFKHFEKTKLTFNKKKIWFEKKKYNAWVDTSFAYGYYTEAFINKQITNPVMSCDDIITHYMLDEYKNLCIKHRVVINDKYIAFFSSFARAQSFYEEIKEHLNEPIIIENNYKEKWQE